MTTEKTESKAVVKGMTKETFNALKYQLMETTLLSRKALLDKLTSPNNRDYNKECDYPDEIETSMLRDAYDREGIAFRVISVYPEESWSEDPVVFESEGSDETAFEVEFKKLVKRLNLWYHLHKIDEVSGIGRYGVLLLGVSDGQPLDRPLVLKTASTAPTPEGQAPSKLQLLYLRAFDESVLTVESREQDPRNPRFGQPNMYSVIFTDDSEGGQVAAGTLPQGATAPSQTQNVHWSRVIHVADNRQLSEVFGRPRLQVVFNRVRDNIKVLGGAGEMYWKGAFPGLALEAMPGVTEYEEDADAIKEQMELYGNGLQRWLDLVGVSVKQLAPTVSDPNPVLGAILQEICIAMAIPKRIFMGSERGELSSGQDAKTWNTRVNARNNKYVSPMIVRPLIDRLIALGILPTPAEETGYTVEWTDKNASTDIEKAELAAKITETLVKYISGGVDAIIPVHLFLTMVMKFDPEMVAEIVKEMGEFEDLHARDEAELEAEAAARAELEGAKDEPVRGAKKPAPGKA